MWVRKFKNAHNIMFRKITKFVTKISLLSKEHLKNKCDTFIENVKFSIDQYEKYLYNYIYNTEKYL